MMTEPTKQDIVSLNKLHLVCDEVRPLPDNIGDYKLALHAAGVDVLDYESFGSYQGEWWAKVKFPNDELYFVNGYFGSCSGCDSFEAEFGWRDDERPDYAHRLKDFGRDYLETCYTREQAIEKASEMVEWLKGA